MQSSKETLLNLWSAWILYLCSDNKVPKNTETYYEFRLNSVYITKNKKLQFSADIQYTRHSHTQDNGSHWKTEYFNLLAYSLTVPFLEVSMSYDMVEKAKHLT